MRKFFALISLLFFSISYPAMAEECSLSTEAVTPPPAALATATLVLMGDAYLGVGQNRDYRCLKRASSISRELISSGTVKNTTVGAAYYERMGMKVTPFQKGAHFKMVEMIVGKHRFEGATALLVLKDSTGELYRVGVPFLGPVDNNVEGADIAFAVVPEGQPVSDRQVDIIGSSTFDIFKDYEYTGEFENPSRPTARQIAAAAPKPASPVLKNKAPQVTTFTPEEVAASLAAAKATEDKFHRPREAPKLSAEEQAYMDKKIAGIMRLKKALEPGGAAPSKPAYTFYSNGAVEGAPNMLVQEQPAGSSVAFVSFSTMTSLNTSVYDGNLISVGIFKDAGGVPGKLIGYGLPQGKQMDGTYKTALPLSEPVADETLYAILYKDGYPVRTANNALVIVKFPVAK